MKIKKEITASFLFIVCFFAGWEIQENFSDLFISNTGTDYHYLQVLTRNYFSENQNLQDVIHYRIDIDLYPAEKKIKCTTDITLVANGDLDSIDLNFYDNFLISSFQVNGKPSVYTNRGTRLSFPNSAEPGDTIIVSVSYEGEPVRAGLSAFTFGEYNGDPVVYNMSEPVYASTWFPCNDLPDDKALLDILITNESKYTSVSNGVLIAETEKQGRSTYHWRTFYPISTYLIAVYSANYTSFSEKYYSETTQDSMEILYYAFPDHMDNAKKDFSGHPGMISVFAGLFGEYPFIKEKYGVAEFLWQQGAMEHQTIIGIGSNFVSGRNFFKDVYVHELAHHWWGNAVGPETWKDIWLNEGFATYSEALYYEALYGEDALHSTMQAKFQSYFSGTLYDPGKNIFSTTVYDKGAWVLHMLRKQTGDVNFFRILQTYFERFKYSNASTEDFKKVCEEITQTDLKKFFDQWIYKGIGQISILYDWKYESVEDAEVIEINIDQTQKEYDVYEFPLDIEIVYPGDVRERKNVFISERNTELKLIVKEKPVQIIPDPNGWLLANISEKQGN